MRSINPWISIWTRPCETMKAMLERGESAAAFWLMIAGTFINTLDRAAGRSAGDGMGFVSILIIAGVTAIVGGLIGYYVAGAVLTWSGRRLGGEGSYRDVRLAIAYSKYRSFTRTSLGFHR